ncbi:acetyltransferase (GNAT) family protein [Oxobacter pfennigii]|uniref:Acetyltransferase (GNAT) family protein n=1 Tax=Oxobacter pfennigii TaxID=36849 RepID=A0A0N8NT03_9CLOT|nr:GNAT family N-acetyltransferase [Oxobacter pfennigii]KPU43472.1 acetyltransferase (GNAT) family protein [Oxobacter pfennigii]
MLTGNKVLDNYEYNIRLLSGDDEIDVQALCERCSDFSELIEGRPPEKDAGYSILFDLPPDKELKDKYVFGVYKENGVLIAVIEIVKDYKSIGEWIIGLLMIDPNERGNGLGRKLHDLIKAWVSEEHGKALRIGVVEENHRGYKFWCEMGYVEADRVKRTYGNKEHTVIVMNSFLK